MDSTILLFEQVIADMERQQYSISTHFFAAPLLQSLRLHLLGKLQDGAFHVAGTGNKQHLAYHPEIRTEKTLWMEEGAPHPVERPFFAQVDRFCQYLNATCYTGIQSYEFQYACYDRGAFYKRHLDRFRQDDSRKFTMITYLNPDWGATDGGELLLYTGNSNIAVQPEFGTTVIFRSHVLEHEVLPANRQRLSITGWLK